MSVRTTIDPKLQIMARQAVARGLIGFDRKRGWRGAVKKVEMQGGDWAQYLGLQRCRRCCALADRRRAGVSDTEAVIGLQPPRGADGKLTDARETGKIPLNFVKWARAYVDGSKLGKEVKKPSEVLAQATSSMWRRPADKGQWHLVQTPDVEASMVAMDPHTGRVLAMVGGFSYSGSQFNRATQAMRQPGSSFKPIVYAAALDNGYTPASVVLDAPVEFRMSDGKVWKPEELHRQVLRAFDPAPRHRAVAQRHDGAPCRRPRHDQDRRPGAAPRHL
jgi:penicillin-binding protein 1A